MNTFVRALTGVFFVVSVVTVVASAQPSWATALGLDGWSLPALRGEMSRLGKEEALLEEQRGSVAQRIAARARLTVEVREGRRSLVATAAAFRALNATGPAWGDGYRTFHDGQSDAEKLCRHVISWVRANPDNAPPSVAEAAARRLEAELADLLRAPGGLRLPADADEVEREENSGAEQTSQWNTGSRPVMIGGL